MSYIFRDEGTFSLTSTVISATDTCRISQQIFAPDVQSCAFGFAQQENQVTVKAAWDLNDDWFTETYEYDLLTDMKKRLKRMKIISPIQKIIEYLLLLATLLCLIFIFLLDKKVSYNELKTKLNGKK